MNRKEIFFSLVLILVIFAVGFFLRIESTEMHGLNETEKQFLTDSNGLPYFYEFDGYFYYRITENYLNNGHFGDSFVSKNSNAYNSYQITESYLKYGKLENIDNNYNKTNNQDISWDSLSSYPPGRPADAYSSLIVYLTLFSYFLIGLFSKLSLIKISFWLPAFISPLAGVVGFIMVRKYSGYSAGFITGILIVTAPLYFLRTVPGFFDTDMFNILLPLLTIFFLSEALETSNRNKMFLYSFAASLSLFAFSLAWGGWSYLVYIISLSVLIYILYAYIKCIKIKHVISVYLTFILISIVLIIILVGSEEILSIISRPIKFISGWQGINGINWPNVFISVSELQKPSLINFIYGLGVINLFLGIFGFFVTFSIMIRTKMKQKYLHCWNELIFIILVFWMLISIFAYANSIRFGILAIPPLAIFSGVSIGIIMKYFNRIPNKLANDRTKAILSIILILIITAPTILNINDSYSVLIPRANDDMSDAALWITVNTPNDTVVITDWSYSYFLTEFAKRPVLVDAGKQNTPRTYWLHKSFATENETLSIGIMRMLSSSGDESYLLLENNTHNTSLTVKIMENILGLPKDEAKQVLINKYGLDENLSNKILNGTHPSKNPHFVVFTDDNMIQAIYWVFYFGDWNFDLGNNDEYLYSLGKNSNFTNSEKVIKYNNGIILDLNKTKASWNGKTPYCIILPENGSYKTYYLNNKSNFCIIFPSDFKNAKIIDKKYVNSLFVKLVLLKQPTKYFKPIYKNNSVIIWKPNYY